MKKRPFSRWNKGQGMVEFAIVFPLLIILIIGIFEFGRVMFSYSVAIAASREAARYGAAIRDIGGGIPQYEDCQGIRNAAKRFGKFAGIEDGDITIKYSNDSGVYSTSCPPSQEVGLADSISITINTSISPITPLGSFTSIPIISSTSRTILNKIRLGESGTGAGSISGLSTDVNFKTTYQTAEETRGTLVVMVELNQIAVDLVTIPFDVTGTAVLGTDYTLTASPVYINPGQTTTSIYIHLINDGITEGVEALFIGIGTPTNATKGPQDIHMVTITDPPFVSFTLADSIKSETDSTTALNIVLSKASTQDVTIPIVSGGTATWGLDYQSYSNPVVIPAGSLSTLLSISIYDDLIDEDQELAVLGLGSPTNALLGAIPMHLMTIIDNDDPPEVAFFTPNQIVSEEIGIFTTQLTLSSVSTKPITVPYTISGTTIPADYIIHNPSPIVFPPGTLTKDINLSILEGDGLEVDETLILTLGTPINASVGSPGVQTIIITENSFMPTVYFSTSTQSANENVSYISVLMQMSNAWSSDVVIPFTVSGSATSGAGQDFTLVGDPIIIPVGYTQGMLQIQINDDTLDELTEQIIITMGSVVNGSPSNPSVQTINILDNDSPPEVNFALSSVNKLETSGLFSVLVTLGSTAAQDVTVPLNLSGSASIGADYSISTTSLVIPSGSSANSFDITINNDSLYDPNETIIVDLGTPINAELGPNTRYIVNIEDDELPVCKVGTHLLTVGTNSITWSITNEGEALNFTGGSITWPEASLNAPRLNEIKFTENTIFSGGEKPTSYTYFAWESFAQLDTTNVTFSFDSNLGLGDHVLVGGFQNAANGTPCSLTEVFQKH